MQTLFCPQPSEAAEGGKATLTTTKRLLQLQAELPVRRREAGTSCHRKAAKVLGVKGEHLIRSPGEVAQAELHHAWGCIFFFNYYFLPSCWLQTPHFKKE